MCARTRGAHARPPVSRQPNTVQLHARRGSTERLRMRRFGSLPRSSMPPAFPLPCVRIWVATSPPRAASCALTRNRKFFVGIHMSLELINTAASLVTVTIVAATALAALIQLRHLRARKSDSSTAKRRGELDGRDFTDAITLVNSHLEEVLKRILIFAAMKLRYAGEFDLQQPKRDTPRCITPSS